MKHKKNLVAILLFLLSIILLFVLLYPKNDTNPSSSKIDSTKEFSVSVRNEQKASDAKILSVSQGDTVSITVISDHSAELHIHGYDKEVQLIGGKPSKVTLRASLSGRFEAELHDSDTVVFVLEVHPR